MPIPKIIHQTAKTSDIPPVWLPFQSAVKAKFPDWEYRLWTDQDNLALVQDRYPKLLPIYTGLARNIMRVDMIRYLIMDTYGGLYLDLDYEFLRPYPFTDFDLVLPRESADSEPVALGNAVFASVPGHPYWKAVIADFLANPPSNYAEVAEEQVLHLTGPGFLTRIYQQSFDSDLSFFIPMQRNFNPPIPANEQERKTLLNDPQVYGIHHCTGTWRALTKAERLVAKIQTMSRRIGRVLRGRP